MKPSPPDQSVEPGLEPTVESGPSPFWSPWATVGWGLVVSTVFVAVQIMVIFGLVLGLARIGSGSLWVPIAMHVTANLVATMEAYFIG